jgi:hypothetical protein
MMFAGVLLVGNATDVGPLVITIEWSTLGAVIFFVGLFLADLAQEVDR